MALADEMAGRSEFAGEDLETKAVLRAVELKPSAVVRNCAAFSDAGNDGLCSGPLLPVVNGALRARCRGHTVLRSADLDDVLHLDWPLIGVDRPWLVGYREAPLLTH